MTCDDERDAEMLLKAQINGACITIVNYDEFFFFFLNHYGHENFLKVVHG